MADMMDEQTEDDLRANLHLLWAQLCQAHEVLLDQSAEMGLNSVARMKNADGTLAILPIITAKAQVLHALSPMVREHRQRAEAEVMLKDIKEKWNDLMSEIKKPVN